MCPRHFADHANQQFESVYARTSGQTETGVNWDGIRRTIGHNSLLRVLSHAGGKNT